MKIEESIHIVFYEFSSSDDKIKDEDDQGDWIQIPTQFSPKEMPKEHQETPINNDSSFEDSL